jgi:aspartate ammonia-lyase
MSTASFRTDHDLLGDRDIPADAYWGVHTLRAVENFPITGQPLSTNAQLVRGLAAVKLAAARTNQELGLLDAVRADAIAEACQEILDGKLHEQFIVDVIQGGAGTSSNMNANEVIANRALEILGHQKGDYSRPRSSACAGCSMRWKPWKRPSPRRRPSSAPWSRWAGPSCRTPCR